MKIREFLHNLYARYQRWVTRKELPAIVNAVKAGNAALDFINANCKRCALYKVCNAGDGCELRKLIEASQ